MIENQRARLEYLREDLKVWEDRRRRARWSLPADKLYNCTAMDKELGAMRRELHDLEELWKKNEKSTRSSSRRRASSSSTKEMEADSCISK